MTFRIDRFVSEGNAIVFCVCGRVQIDCVDTIKELIEGESAKISKAICRSGAGPEKLK
jgi:hypothetical protein